MAEKDKVAVTPVVEKPKVTEDEPIIDNPRAEIEKIVNADSEIVPDTPEEKKDPPTDEATTPIDKIKKSVQKRINKEVAKRKTVEDELAETKAELERLKSVPIAPAKKDDAPLTIEQVEEYIIKMREEGNVKEEISATRFLIKMEKESAIKEVRDEQAKVLTTQETAKTQQLNDWTDLQKDYQVYDGDGAVVAGDEMNLSNQKGLLYTTALDLYNDKSLHKDFYNDPDVVKGFRRAVADAYREIHQQGLNQKKVAPIVPLKPAEVLADPGSEKFEEPEEVSANLSDADKVREEIKARRKTRK